MASSSSSLQSSLVVRRLYRSLLKASKPFTLPSPNAVVFNCLFHRTGLDDKRWEDFLREGEQLNEEPAGRPHRTLFCKLLQEVVTGDRLEGVRQMQFPKHVSDDYYPNTNRLRDIIRREFRDDRRDDSLSSLFSNQVRKEVAFLALRELNKKLAYIDRLEQKAPEPHPQQAARNVQALPFRPPSSYLRPGAYLIAHPHLTGYFRRTVICILDHVEEEDEAGPNRSYGTYGLIVNRISLSPTGKNLTLQEILRPLPEDLKQAFSGSLVKEGGPVHMSLQMLHSSTPDQEELKIGGTVISMISSDDHESTAIHSDRAIKYRGDIMRAAQAIMEGRLDREDVTFFVGASSWTVGQLESEIERGCWLPCRGPPEIAHSGICEHEPTEKDKARPKADLWLSMMSACGEDEAKLAHLVWNDDGKDPNSGPCDEFQ